MDASVEAKSRCGPRMMHRGSVDPGTVRTTLTQADARVRRVSRWIAEERERHGWSRRDLGLRVGLSSAKAAQTVGQWERATTAPTILYFFRLQWVFKSGRAVAAQVDEVAA